MPIPFPGMDPWLERPDLWRGVHTQLIVDVARALNPLLRPRYRVAINYTRKPVPNLSDDDARWADVRLRAQGLIA